MTSVLADSIPGIRVVKAFAQEQREIDRFHHANDRVLSAYDRVNRHLVVLQPRGPSARRRRPAGDLGFRPVANLSATGSSPSAPCGYS